ncbi:MAG: heavy metal-binding domain-containing protein [Candidatus Thermoplasmatota archaeon]|jgi:uncharacterized protein YbjQ (UPF0145 family)|nr:heavy metal-binding domain-containing protein [Candidatus Thermoplasmatota archaeon]MCL5681154.1 heavy metal-binding domain-containing protein [Candidatus Thermoplasmatota archaeon]
MFSGNYNSSSPDMVVVSTPYVPGYKITSVVGFTWGLIVRSRGIGGNVVASLRTIAGGEIKEYTQMLDQSRFEALERLKQHAKSLGANAVIEVRFDSSEIGQVMSEILAYGTAVVVEKESAPTQPVALR